MLVYVCYSKQVIYVHVLEHKEQTFYNLHFGSVNARFPQMSYDTVKELHFIIPNYYLVILVELWNDPKELTN